MSNAVPSWRQVLVLASLWFVCLPGCHPALGDSEFVYRPELALSGSLVEELRWTASLEPQITSDVRQAGEIALVGLVCWAPGEGAKGPRVGERFSVFFERRRSGRSSGG
ncbi:MAG: hypothetical protein JXR37_34830 [Kiritimatiellae bacterium]|nr:hypothetical protein [Kiritimatiellia bacterium]